MCKVSIIVAAYNVEKYIKKCMNSLLNQTLSDIQIIVVNDGSKDNTKEIVESINDSRVLLCNKINGGLSDARNFGLGHAVGEYVAFVDGDDYVEPNMYEIMYNCAKKNNSDLVECAYYKDFETKTLVHDVVDRSLDVVKFTPYNAWNKLYKKSVFDKTGLLFTKGIWYEDLEFNLKLSRDILNTSFVHIPLYHYIQREGSITHSLNIKILDEINMQKGVYEYLSLQENYDFSDVEYYFAKSLLISSLIRLCKYDVYKKTNYSKNNYKILVQNYPYWRRSRCLKKNSKVNLYLKMTNKCTFFITRNIIKVYFLFKKNIDWRCNEFVYY